MSWRVNPIVAPEHLQDFALSVLNISTQLRQVEENPSTYLVSASRSISVELRKLLLDGANSLVRRCVQKPRLHRLLQFDELRGDLYTVNIGVSSGILQCIQLDGDGRAEFPIAPVQFTATVHPLPGLRYNKSSDTWVSGDPFDRVKESIRIDAWLKQPLLEIDDTQYTIGAVLTEVANTQGAHADSMRGNLRLWLREHFFPIYLNIFTFLMGVYVVDQVDASSPAGSSLWREIVGRYPVFDGHFSHDPDEGRRVASPRCKRC